MKKYLTFSCIMIVFLIFYFLLFLKEKTEEKKIPEYDATIICKKTGTITEEEQEISYENRAYITVDNERNIEKVILQTIDNDLSSATYILEEQLLHLYNSVSGITGSIENIEDKHVLTITYDYTKISLSEVRKKLGGLLDDAFILKKIKSLPISFEMFKKSELEGYECHE